MTSSSAAPIIVFGAFDRHNFGDLLFPHIVSALLPRHKQMFAGLAARDLRSCGGHHVHALPDLLARWEDMPPVVLHAGGEIMGCDAWEAAVMLQSSEAAQAVIRRWDDKPSQRRAWAASYLGVGDVLPYLVSATRLPTGSRLVCNAVGGVELESRDKAMRAEAREKIEAMDAVGVRDAVTLAWMKQAHIAALLLPDPAALTAELFHARIAAKAATGEVAAMRAAFPRGYIAMQFSADFGDDATLQLLAAQMKRIVRDTGHGIVLFRAGAAPWHDDAETYRRLVAWFEQDKPRLFSSLDLWDICALIAGSRAYCGSSLHGRIVAMAYGLPRLNLVHASPSGRPGKQAAYAASWDSSEMPAVAPASALHAALMQAVSVPKEALSRIAQRCTLAYREGFASLCRQAGL